MATYTQDSNPPRWWRALALAAQLLLACASLSDGYTTALAALAVIAACQGNYPDGWAGRVAFLASLALAAWLGGFAPSVVAAGVIGGLLRALACELAGPQKRPPAGVPKS